MRLLPPTPRALTHPHLNLEAFVDAGRGQVTIGQIKPIHCAAMAAQGKKIWVALVRRGDESVVDLLERLDAALGKAQDDDVPVDEVSPLLKLKR